MVRNILEAIVQSTVHIEDLDFVAGLYLCATQRVQLRGNESGLRIIFQSIDIFDDKGFSFEHGEFAKREVLSEIVGNGGVVAEVAIEYRRPRSSFGGAEENGFEAPGWRPHFGAILRGTIGRLA
jgi:hypothetical protein